MIIMKESAVSIATEPDSEPNPLSGLENLEDRRHDVAL